MFMARLHNRCLYTEGQRKEVNVLDQREVLTSTGDYFLKNVFEEQQ